MRSLPTAEDSPVWCWGKQQHLLLPVC